MLEQDTLDSIQYHLNLAVIILPVLLALAVTINSRMKYRDKWSVCIMAADCLASEIYKFRMQAVECTSTQARATSPPTLSDG